MADTPYLFVSYASADRERVLPIVERLAAAGVQTWVDREGIHGGANYAQVISDAIKGAAALLLVASPASLASRNVRQELALGWRYERPYLPLLLDPVAIPDELAYWLEGSQWIELLERPASAWLPALGKALDPLGISLRLAQAPSGRARPLLVGREREQEALRGHLDRMLAGQGSVVLVGGEAGIGKTTLVEDLSAQAEEEGALVFWGHAYDLSVTPPYGPWLEIFRQYRRLGGTLPPVPDFVFNADELAKVGSQESLFAEVADFLRTVAEQRALILVLDDLHWADQASLDFFRFLARQLADQRLLLVATYRSDELTRRHPLYTLLPLLVREASALRLEVHPLDAGGHQALIQERYALIEDDRARLEQYLVERAEGNPLYAGELLRTLEEEQVLRREGDAWTLGDLERVRVPRLLMQVIEARLARLSDETRSLLQLAAVIGQEVPLALWQQVSGASDEALVTAIEEAQGAQLLVEVPGGISYQFRHALLREALYQEVVALRRRVWHRQVGEVLAETAVPDPDLVAYHFQQAGNDRATEWLIKAGERAQAAYAWPAAVDRFEAAHARLTAREDSAREQAVLLFRIAFLLRFLDERKALTNLDEARRLASEVSEQALASHCLHLSGLLYCFLGEPRRGIPAMEQGVHDFRALPDTEQARLPALLGSDPGPPEGTLALWLAGVGRLDAAVAVAKRMLAEIPQPAMRAGQGDSLYGDGLFGLAWAEALLGHPRPAEEAFQQARAIYHAIEHHNLVVYCCYYALEMVQLAYFTEERDARDRWATEGEDAMTKAGSVNSRSEAPMLVSLSLQVLAGNWRAAREAADVAYGHGRWMISVLAARWLATLACRQGDVAFAWRVIADYHPDGPRNEPGNTFLASALPLQRLAAEMSLDTGDLSTARAWLEAHDRWLEWSGAVLGQAEGALLWARYHQTSGDLPQARALAEQGLTHASDPRQPLALLAVQRFLGQLDTEEHTFDTAEEHLQQSLTLAEACQAPFERALTLLELARLRAAQGKPDEARALLTDIQTICEPLGARPTLERVAALERELTGSAGGDA